ncbi:hypothetical protein [Peribacillus simplex]|uniref:hypothetical protein n=1 Tax=Peribacillus simplex TaxID=1478 RepID=UPI003D2B3A60
MSNSLAKEITSAFKKDVTMNISIDAEYILIAPLNKEKEAKRQETRDVNGFISNIPNGERSILMNYRISPMKHPLVNSLYISIYNYHSNRIRSILHLPVNPK